MEPTVVAELVKGYTAGETLLSLAARYPFSYSTIRIALINAGVTMRPPKILLPPTPPDLVTAYQRGRSIQQLADVYGMSYNQTRRILLAEGVRLRGRGRYPTRREVSGTPPR